MNNTVFRIGARAMILLVGISSSIAAYAADLERPPVQFVDKLGVNMANGQVTNSLNTLSIGGAMGLSHSVSVYANEFNYPSYRGFADKYYNRAMNVRQCEPSSCTITDVMRVQDWSDSQSFEYTGVTGYTAINDERHTLEVSGTEFLWTKPDGTVVHFERGGTGLPASNGGVLSQVDYPNGFTIWVKQGSVNTNTGFQLKYYFDATNPPLDKTEPAGLQAPAVSSNWVLYNPLYVRGINAWKVYCPWTIATCAAAGNEWPTAKFEWPAGMPRTMYIGDSLVKVTDSAQRVTTYKFHAYDLSLNDDNDVVPPYVLNTQFSPRLKEVTLAGATSAKYVYDYKNLFAANMFRLDYRLQTAGVVKNALRLGLGGTYTINQQYQGTDTQNLGNSEGGVYLVHQQKYEGNPSGTYYVDTLDGRIWFETTRRNFPIKFEKTGAPVEQYFYNTRSNLTKVTYNVTAFERQAEYPTTCTNRKTCNQATRIRDANGNWTDYEYDSTSGQVTKITYPANKEGLRAQTRYGYTQLFATYYNSAGVKTLSSQGIWMKTSEKYCINSAASGGTCAGADEVVTTFEYNHPNLLLTGMLVTSPTGSRRTCYRYDDFGNQIGVTTPNANLASCPGVTP
ncbi:MAG TPA: hypothetical protein VMF52_09250 [Steroidobacteraceae bacterium]|nr:hypothetical protein [Steroidobacteraceae bacterium]